MNGLIILLNGLERNCGVTVFLKMRSYIPPFDSSSAAARIADSESSQSNRPCHSRRITNNPMSISRGVSAQTPELRMR